MYIKRVHGKTLRIGDNEMIGILDRYNIDNFEILNTANGETVYRNRTKCTLCEKYYHKACLRCPFKTFEDYKYGELIYGCEVALRTMTGLEPKDVSCNMDELVFYGYNKDKIIGIINNMYEFFANFKYI